MVRGSLLRGMFALICFAVGLAMVSLAAAQQPVQQPAQLSIRSVLLDLDSDQVPDSMGTRVRIAGVVTIDPYSARKGTTRRISVQDDSAAIRCVARDPALLDDIRRGHLVSLSGLVGEYRGMTQLELDSVDDNGAGECPPPLEVDTSASWSMWSASWFRR